jgi:putative transposase
MATRSLCRALGVSWRVLRLLGRAPSGRSRDNERLTGQIRMSFIESDRTYGSPHVWLDLREWGKT